MDSEPSSTVRRLSVEEVAPPSKPKAAPPSPLATRMAEMEKMLSTVGALTPAEIRSTAPTPAAYSTLDVAVAAFAGLGYALSARSLLLFALIGAFGLALIAMHDQTMQTLVVLFVYCVFTIPPMVYLEVRKQPRRE